MKYFYIFKLFWKLIYINQEIKIKCIRNLILRNQVLFYNLHSAPAYKLFYNHKRLDTFSRYFHIITLPRVLLKIFVSLSAKFLLQNVYLNIKILHTLENSEVIRNKTEMQKKSNNPERLEFILTRSLRNKFS